ncbi:MAG: ABC transporter ATP-binding protein [Cyanobacteriota bacterium]
MQPCRNPVISKPAIGSGTVEAMSNQGEPSPWLEMQGICKGWPGVMANEHVSLKVNAGEVHALLGENGAGKSTLVNILYGIYQPDAGSIVIGGQVRSFRRPADAIQVGIGMVPQHFLLVPTLRVVENIALGVGSWGLRRLNLRPIAQQIETIAAQYDWQVDPWAYVRDLSLGTQQRVEILRALFRQAKLLIMDEPTSVLTPAEVKELQKMIRQFTTAGGSVIFISHKLDEVLSTCDRITVMRDGKTVGTLVPSQIDKRELARLMVGRDITHRVTKPVCQPGAPILEVRQVWAKGTTLRSTLKDISLTVRQGEILGIAGVDGNGQAELSRVLSGMQTPEVGSVILQGRPLSQWLQESKTTGSFVIGHIPEDRHHMGLAMDMDVGDNIVLRHLVQQKGRIPFSVLRARALQLCNQFGIRSRGLHQPVRQLSGGNQQRVIFARETGEKPLLLIAVQPTQGLDIAATQEVFGTLLRLRQEGVAIVYISTELEEVLTLSDSLGILSQGRLQWVENPQSLSREDIGLLMGGADVG